MNRQQGFTLVELMIAGIISVFIIAGLLNFFIATNKSVTLSDTISKNQEVGRFAMEYLTKFIRRAGYSEIFNTFTPPLYISFNSSNIGPAINCTGPQALACASDFDDLANTPPTSLDPSYALGDRLSIPYTVSRDDVNTVTCTGEEVTGTIAAPRYLVDVFWISDDKELRCITFDRDSNNWLNAPSSAAGVPIINNIERMDFLIGINPNPDARSTTQYVNIDAFTPPSLLSVLNIRSIRIAILTTSSDDIDTNALQSNTTQREYILLDAPTIKFNDSSLRNIFMTTIEFPNMIETSGT